MPRLSMEEVVYGGEGEIMLTLANSNTAPQIVDKSVKPIWASEVEPYPIAVTKSRFKEVNDG